MTEHRKAYLYPIASGAVWGDALVSRFKETPRLRSGYMDFTDAVRAGQDGKIHNMGRDDAMAYAAIFLEDQHRRRAPDFDELIHFGEIMRLSGKHQLEGLLAKFADTHDRARGVTKALKVVVYTLIGFWPGQRNSTEPLVSFLVRKHAQIRKLTSKGEKAMTNLVWEALKLGLVNRLRSEDGGLPEDDVCELAKRELRKFTEMAGVDKQEQTSLTQRFRHDQASLVPAALACAE